MDMSEKNLEGSKEAIAYKKMLREYVAKTANCSVDYEAENNLSASVDWNMFKTEGYKIEQIKLENCNAKLLIPREDNNKDKVIIMIHGGAYYQGLEDKYVVMAQNYSLAFSNSRVLIVDYSLAPKNLYPMALNDVIDSYKYLLSNGYKSENIIFAGDSAGGGLVLSSALYLRDHNAKLPKAIITASASTNLCYDGESWTKNLDIDPLLGRHSNPDLIKPIYAENDDLKNPYISALYGDLTGLPDVLMQVGTHEVILSDTLDFTRKARKAGVNVQQTTYQGMFHCFQIVPSLPESKDAWKEISQFLHNLYNK